MITSQADRQTVAGDIESRIEVHDVYELLGGAVVMSFIFALLFLQRRVNECHLVMPDGAGISS